ncbi:MAG: lipoyl(octanoyl) transferase LipB [Gemmatimonadota bacterium]
MKRSVTVVSTGRVDYGEALAVQRRLARAKIRGSLSEDFLLLVEHEPVVTLGRGADPDHIVVAPERLAALGIARVEIERGGDVTYHGPGQLVGYPILDLAHFRTDLHWFLRRLEEALLWALAALGIAGCRVPGYTGVWVGETGEASPDGSLPRPEAARLVSRGDLRKIASIGVHVSRWVTWHGFALNVTDAPLERFELIVPCGLAGVRMTSLRAEGVETGEARIVEHVMAGFGRAFGVRCEPSPERNLDVIDRRIESCRHPA